MATSLSPVGGKSTLQLIFIPALASLVVTLWRLTGELMAWSESWFNPAAGGFGAIVGITWLAPIFGVYFALEMVKRGPAPSSLMKSQGLALLGMLILFGGGLFQEPIYLRNYQLGLIYIWFVGVVAAAVQYRAWPSLFKTLLAYALAVRIPVIVIMFLAMWGNWGTHYDAIPPAFPELGWLANWVWLALFPQLLFWVSFTIVTGIFSGILVAGLASRRKSAPA